jgi:hypothetical protein
MKETYFKSCLKALTRTTHKKQMLIENFIKLKQKYKKLEIEDKDDCRSF